MSILGSWIVHRRRPTFIPDVHNSDKLCPDLHSFASLVYLGIFALYIYTTNVA